MAPADLAAAPERRPNLPLNPDRPSFQARTWGDLFQRDDYLEPEVIGAGLREPPERAPEHE